MEFVLIYKNLYTKFIVLLDIDGLPLLAHAAKLNIECLFGDQKLSYNLFVSLKH